MAKMKKYDIMGAISKGKYNYIKDQEEALIALNKKLEEYPQATRKRVIEQMDIVETTPALMLTFIEATERYNKHMNKAYNKAVREVIKPAWQKTVEAQSDAWKRRMFTDKGVLTEEGKDVYKKFLDDRIGAVVPKVEKHITLSKTQMEHINFQKTLETRLNMGISSYIDKRTDQYFENYITAMKKKRANPQKFIDLYNTMTREEKILFSKHAEGMISYQYNNADDEKLYYEMKEVIEEIKSISKA